MTSLQTRAFADYRSQLEAAVRAGNATEHTFRPALKSLIETLAPGVTATNEPKRVSCGAPDFIIEHGPVPLGYIETKDIDAPLWEIEGSEQMGRYLAGLPNLILTDYLEFRWYVKGQHRRTARLATRGAGGKLRLEADGVQRLFEMLQAFLTERAPSVGNAKELAGSMAVLARMLYDALREALAIENDNGPLHDYLASFREVLLLELTAEQFADMYAQSVCYGLFTAACNPEAVKLPVFTRREADRLLPRTNPFLKRMFKQLAESEIDDYPFVWVVDTLADLLNRADLSAILQDFGKGTGREDPVVHFYETFLTAYDPKMREMRGVYYTPTQVVSYIVHSVDDILKRDFGLKDGLADTSTVRIPRSGNVVAGAEEEFPRVLILDPATGTGTFLHEVIARIYAAIVAKKQLGGWSSYVAEHLLPRLIGFELLMAPYAVAHMKLGMQLNQLGYDFGSQERLRIFLTNTLEEPHDLAAALPMARWLAEEARSANTVKRDLPILVVLGNPPYSGNSANKGTWITSLLHGYDSTTGKSTANYFMVDGAPLGERNPKWLNDDYVKFIRFAQWRIERTGFGVLAFITNNGYLDNPTFRGMRLSLMQTFDDIYLLDLHGNSKKKERAPDGGKDENVFDIMQGVVIGIFVKRMGAKSADCVIRHAHLWGTREHKYAILANESVESTLWNTLAPASPFYLFVPQESGLRKEYEKGWKVTEIFPVNSLGIATARDSFTVHFTKDEVWATLMHFLSLSIEEARIKFELGKDARDWKVDLAQKDLRSSGPTNEMITAILYRPFDKRYTYYTGNTRGFHCMPRKEVMQHMLLGENLGLSTTRSIEIKRGWEHVFCTRNITQLHTVSIKEVNYLFPLYLYPNGPPKARLFELDEPSHAPGGRRPNLSPAFVLTMEETLKIAFNPGWQRRFTGEFWTGGYIPLYLCGITCTELPAPLCGVLKK